MPYRRFDTFWEAFGYCREVGHIVLVVVKDELYRLFPSGRAERICALAPPAGDAQQERR